MANQNPMEKTTPGILILSHGPLCRAVMESAEMIAGTLENVTAVSLEYGMEPSDYVAEARKAMDTMPEGSIVMFDLAFGTPFNQLILAYQSGKLEGICGFNLPILIEALSLRETLSGRELAQGLVDFGKTTIMDVGEFTRKLQ